MSKSKMKICVIAMGVMCCITTIAHAEGGGKRQGEMKDGAWKGSDWGVNRRVITQEGYTEVSGTFTVNEMIILADVNGKITTRSNYADDKPTFYLGSKGGLVEVDAGLQYEPKIRQDKKGNSYLCGWSIVFSKNGAYASIRKQAKVTTKNGEIVLPFPWRGKNSTYTLDYKIWPGSIDQTKPKKRGSKSECRW